MHAPPGAVPDDVRTPAPRYGRSSLRHPDRRTPGGGARRVHYPLIHHCKTAPYHFLLGTRRSWRTAGGAGRADRGPGRHPPHGPRARVEVPGPRRTGHRRPSGSSRRREQGPHAQVVGSSSATRPSWTTSGAVCSWRSATAPLPPSRRDRPRGKTDAGSSSDSSTTRRAFCVRVSLPCTPAPRSRPRGGPEPPVRGRGRGARAARLGGVPAPPVHPHRRGAAVLRQRGCWKAQGSPALSATVRTKTIRATGASIRSAHCRGAWT